MKMQILLLTLSSLIATPSLAKHGQHKNHSHTDFAKVVKVKPIYEKVSHRVPVEQCHQEKVHRSERRHRSHTPIIVGGVLGAAIGHELGTNGDSRKVGAVAGGLLGAALGHDISNRHHHRNNHRQRPHYREVCETSYRHERSREIVGYKVKYRYKGQSYWTRTQSHPGRRIKVRVHVDPLSS